MKILTVLAFVAGVLTAAPALAAAPGANGLCGPDAPEAYKRPGGYCEAIGANGSLSGFVGGGPVGEFEGPGFGVPTDEDEEDDCLCEPAVS